MYVNKCIKCGREFETKNPKRVICPDCLYPDKNMMLSSDNSGSSGENVETHQQTSANVAEQQPQFYSSYSSGGDDSPRPYNRPQRSYNNDRNNYNRDARQGGYNRNNNYNRQGGYNRDARQGGYNRNNSYNRPNGNYNRNGNFQQRRPQRFNNNNNRRPQGNRNKAPKQLLISREQLEQIELLYKLMLPLPNPDAHEAIGEKLGIEPRKVFFGINLVRQKLMLPKLPFPKRKLAITPDQLNAIKMLYEPLLPLPPIGCHKIIASQLKMDEWRVHVGIGLVRTQMGLDRWNQERADLTDEMKKHIEETNALRAAKKAEMKAAKLEEQKKKAENNDAEAPEETSTESSEESVLTEEAPKKKRGRKPKAEEESQPEE